MKSSKIEKASRGDTRILVKNARLSFPSLAEPSAFQGGDPKYQVTLLIDKTPENEKAVDAIALKALEAKFGAKDAPAKLALYKKKDGKYALIDGDAQSYEEMHGKFIIRPKRDPKSGLPILKLYNDKMDPNDLDKIRNTFYSGCYVNCFVDLYTPKLYDGVFASLAGIQFVSDGERLSSAVPVDESDFEDIEVSSDFDDVM